MARLIDDKMSNFVERFEQLDLKVDGLRSDVDGLRSDVDGLRSDVENLNGRVDRLEKRSVPSREGHSSGMTKKRNPKRGMRKSTRTPSISNLDAEILRHCKREQSQQEMYASSIADGRDSTHRSKWRFYFSLEQEERNKEVQHYGGRKGAP